MKSLWHLDAHTTVVKTGDPVPLHPGNVQLRSQYSLISLGTELLVAKGKVPEDLHAHMRVPYMEGEFLFPIKYGYSLVGTVHGSGVLCHLMYPHQSDCDISPVDLFEIPPGIPPQRATLAANLETALTGIWDGEVKPGQRIAVVGFGMIGSLVARIAADIPGTYVAVIETHPGRKEYARKMGFNVLADTDTAIDPFDVAFHASATQEGLQCAIDLVGLEGLVVEMSWYGNASVRLNLGGDFHLLRKRIISSQVSRIPQSMQALWNFRRRKRAVFDLLQNPAYDQHITHVITLDEAAELFNTWRVKAPEGLGYCIRY